jgi:hypothetical protein
MIKITASLLGENISITIDDGRISIDTKNKIILELIESIYSDLLASYSPADGSLGGNLAQELAKMGAKITEVIEPSMDENLVY